MTTQSWPDHAAHEYVARLSDLQAEIRTQVVHGQLVRHIQLGASVVDVGGGDGRQSIRLARRGHDVTIVEPSSVMRAHCARRLESESADVVARVRLVEGSAASATDVVGSQRFDAVLCHGVLPYVEDPASLIASLYSVAAPGALLSIIAKNATALPIMPSHHGRWDEVLDLFDADRVVNNMGIMTRADTPANLSRIVEGLDATVDRWYGISFFTQGQSAPRDTIPDDVFAAILAAELAASQRDPFRQLSNMFHLLARCWNIR
jgi:SAM-dependent methyltransferase